MSLGVFLAVLGAALLHALWNALIKVGDSKLSGLLIMTIVQGLIGVAVVALRPLPQGEVWSWLIGGGVIHSAYKYFLSYAYQQGDLSRVYPISRGAAPMIVLAVGAVFLSDRLSGIEVAGILVLGIGIVLMAHGVFSQNESRKLLPFALATAGTTAAYTLVDGVGARLSGDPFTYVGWLFVFDMLMFTGFSVAFRGLTPLRVSRRAWAMGALASGASFSAFAIVVWAMTVAPIALVSALRETSILAAVLIGWLLFGDRMHAGKLAAAGLIVAGVVLMRL